MTFPLVGTVLLLPLPAAAAHGDPCAAGPLGSGAVEAGDTLARRGVSGTG